MQPMPLISPSVVLAALLKHGGERKRSWLWRIDRGHAWRRIASHALRCHGERSQSSPGPRSKPPATTCPPVLIPVPFLTFSTLLLARGVLFLTRNFQTLNLLKALLTSMPISDGRGGRGAVSLLDFQTLYR